MAANPDQTVTIMCEGRSFYRFVGQGKNAIKLFYVPGDPDELGSLYWCDVNERVRRPNQRFPLNSLTDVYIGKQTSSFLSNPVAAVALEDHCFSLCSAGVTLDLEAGDINAVTQWLFGINYVLTNDGKLVVSNDEAPPPPPSARTSVSRTSAPVPAPPSSAKGGRRFTVAPSSAGPDSAAAAAVAAANLAPDAFGADAGARAAAASAAEAAAAVGRGVAFVSPHDPLYAVKTGGTFTRYVAAGKDAASGAPTGSSATQVRVWYASSPGEAVGALYFCDPSVSQSAAGTIAQALTRAAVVAAGSGKTAPFVQGQVTRVSLDTMTDLFLGKQCADFADFPEASVEATFSVVNDDGTFSFEADGRATLSAWIACINVLLNESDTSVVEATSEPAPAPVVAAAPAPTVSGLPAAGGGPSRSERRFTVKRGDSAAAAAAMAAAPASSSAAAAAAAAETLSMQRSSLVKMMIKGLPFVLHAPVTNAGPIKLAFDDKLLALTFTPQQSATPAFRLPLANLIDVFMGKQRKDFAQAPTAAKAAPKLSLSLVAKDLPELALEAGSHEALTSFVAALNDMLALAGRECATEQAPAPAPATAASAAAGAGPAKGGRRFTVRATDAGAAAVAAAASSSSASGAAAASGKSSSASASAALAVDQDLLMEMMAKGTGFVGFAERAGKVIRNRVALFYLSPAELRAMLHGPRALALGTVPANTKGRLCWCAPGRRDVVKHCYMEVGDITDVYLGKQTKLLASCKEARDAPQDECFSLLSRHDQLDLQAESAASLQAWLQGLQLVLTSGGRATVTVEAAVPQGDDEDQRLVKDKRSKRFSVAHAAAPAAAVAATAAVAAGGAGGIAPLDAASTAQLSASQRMSQDSAVQFMVKGASFTRYWDTKDGGSHKRAVLLFLQPTDAGGALCWCDASETTRSIKAEARVAIADITDVYIGKHTKALKTLVPADASDKTCVSLVAGKRVVNLQAASVQAMTAWIEGIQHVIALMGRGVEEVDPGTADAGAAPVAAASSGAAAAAAAAPAAAPAPEVVAPAGPAGGKGTRRFTVKAPSAAAAAAALAASSAPATAASSPASATALAQTLRNPAVAVLREGLLVTDFIATPAGSVVSDRRRFAFSAADGAVGPAGAFYLLDEDGVSAVPASALKPADLGEARAIVPVHALTDVVIGKADPYWAGLPAGSAASAARTDRCFSLRAKGAAIHVEAASKDDVAVVLAAIQALISASGRQAYVEEKAPTPAAGGAAGAGAAATGVKGSRKLSILPASGAAAAGGAVAKGAAFQSISLGSHFVLYAASSSASSSSAATAIGQEGVSGDVAPRDAHVFYSPDAYNGAAALCWTVAASDSAVGAAAGEQKRVTPLSGLRGVLYGKQTDAFADRAAARAADAKCFSLVFEDGLRLDLEADTSSHVTGWQQGLRRVVALNNSGFPAGSSLAQVPHTSTAYARDAVVVPVGASPAVAALEGSGIEAALFAGEDAAAAAASTAGTRKHGLKLRLDSSLGSSGALTWWSAAGLEGQFLLDSVQLVLHGLASADLVQAASSSAAGEAGFSHNTSVVLVGARGRTVSVVCASRADAALLIQAVDQQLITGRAAARVQADAAAATTTVSIDGPSPASSASGSAAAGAAAGPVRTMMGLDNDSLMSLLVDGGCFLRVPESASDEDDLQEVRLAHQPFRQGHRGGALIWAASSHAADFSQTLRTAWLAAAAANNPVYVDAISDLIVGKAARAFQLNPKAAAVEAELCFALVSGKGDELALVAKSREDATTWLLAVQTLLASLGGSIIANPGVGPALSAPAVFSSESKAASAPSTPAGAVPTAAGKAKRRFTVLPGIESLAAGAALGGTGTGTGSGYTIPDAVPDDPTETVLQLAARDDAVVGAAQEDTVAMMEKGREFNVYPARDRPAVRAFVRYVRPVVSTGSKGQLSWQAIVGGAVAGPVQTLQIDAVTDVYMGKQSAELSGTSAASAPADCCFSMHAGAAQSLSIQADAKVQVSAWLFGLSHILSGAGKGIVLGDSSPPASPAAAPASSSGANATNKGRRYTVMPNAAIDAASAAAGAGASSSAAATAVADAFAAAAVSSRAGTGRKVADSPVAQPLVDGDYFTLYTRKGVAEVFVWLDELDSSLGGRAFCFEPAAPGGREMQRFISMRQTRFLFAFLTDVFVGAQHSSFFAQGHKGRKAVSACCVSFVGLDKENGVKHELHLEAASVAVHGAWLKGIQHVLEHQGTIVVQERADADEAARQRAQAAVFEKYSASHLLQLVMEGREEVKCLSLAETLRVLTAGEIFNIYPALLDASAATAAAAAGTLKPTQGKVQYVQRGVGKGELVWPGGSAPLAKLADIVLGLTPPFKQVEPALAKDRCVSLVFDGAALSIEALSRAQLSRWMWGLNALLRHTGRATQATQPVPAPTPSPAPALSAAPASPSSSSVSLAPPTPTTRPPALSSSSSAAPAMPKTRPPALSSAASPRNAASSVAAPSAASPSAASMAQSLASDPTVMLMNAGQTYFVYSLPKGAQAGTIATRVECAVWYDLSEHAFVWVPRRAKRVIAADRSNVLPLASVSDVYMGRARAELKTPASDDVDASCLASIIGATELHLEADTQEQLQAFLTGVSHLLTIRGTRVIVEDSAQGAAAEVASPASAAAAAAGAAPESRAASGSTAAPLKKARRFTVLPAESAAVLAAVAAPAPAPAAAPAPAPAPAVAAAAPRELSAFEKGTEVTWFIPATAVGTAPERRPALLWSEAATIYWTAPPARTAQGGQALKLSELSDIFVGRQLDFTRQPALSDVADGAIVSLSGGDKGAEVTSHFAAKTPEALEAWLDLISAALNNTGKEVVDVAAPVSPAAAAAPEPVVSAPSSTSAAAAAGVGAAPAKKASARNRRMTVRPYEAPTDLPTNPHDVMSQIAAKSATLLAIDAGSTLRMLAEGRDSWAIASRASDFSVTQQRISLFHNPDTNGGATPLGTLCWSDAGTRAEHPDRSLALHRVEDVFVGKQTAVLLAPELKSVDNNCCVSIVAGGEGAGPSSVDLICDTPEQLATWLFGLNAVLTGGSAGSKRVTLQDTSTTSAQGAKVDRRRFSVLPITAADFN